MDSEEINNYKKSGKISAVALQFGVKMIKPGVKLLDVCDAVEEKIKELGGGIAFPVQISMNDIAAHYCPEEDDEIAFKDGDLVSLDCGATFEGYVSDNAMTINLGDHDDVIKASREALAAALKLVEPGRPICDIGAAIQQAIEKHGFSPVRNLSGHGIGKYIVHQGPSIPNFDTGHKDTLESGVVVAIEPFASTGAGMIYESGNATVFMLQQKRPIRSQFARDVLKTIDTYDGLPFTTRWLTRIHGVGKTKLGIKELLNAGIIRGYPPLPDVKHGLVSQSEHSVIVLDKPIIITNLE